MKNKDFISELSRRVGYDLKKTEGMLNATYSTFVEQLQENNTVSIQGFGVFEVKKKAERVSVNPVTQLRMLVPPKLVVTYKPSTVLKEKFKKR